MARLDTQAQREVKHRLKEIDMPEIMEWFKQEGIEQGIEQGVSWEIITSATGIKPEDLELP